ncbi:tetratricopeptide repeat protein [Aquimarina aquimarini]|uniref:tetratricopeptide repeat protein n=1 Tax=Aquimarina aquimarini TaxID=1191734 RepID=UPI001F358353|nr:tetratricopeptide repeat protein [Aquimarina aquimarini]
MNIKHYFFILLVTLCSCNTDFSKKLAILEIDEKYKSGALEEAKTEVNEYIKKEADNEFAWTLLGHIESGMDKDSLALIAYKKALTINQKTVEAITGMGILSRKKGNYDEASAYYNKAIQINPNYAEAYSSLVVINLKRKKFDEAVKVGLKGYNLDKEGGTIVANLAVAYHYAKDTIQREKYFEIAKKNGYKNMETLRQIFNNELTVFD